MRLFLIFLLFITVFHDLKGQKLKDKPVSFKHLKAPSSPKLLPVSYHFVVREDYYNAQGQIKVLTVVSKTSAYDARSNFYKGTEGLGHINGYQDARMHPDSSYFFIELSVSLPDDGLRKMVSKITAPGTIYHYAIPFRLPMTFKAWTPDSSLFYARSSKDTTFEYTFPIDYSPYKTNTSYPSESALGVAYEANRANYMSVVRNDIVKKWLYQTKMDFSSHFAKQRTQFSFDLYYIKEKKGGFEDVEVLVAKMDTLFGRLDANIDNSYQKNWHGTYYQKAFAKLTAEWDLVLKDEVQKTRKSQTARFDVETVWSLYKNQLWCMFFSGLMKEVIQLCKELEEERIENPVIFGPVKFLDILSKATDYYQRYLANPDLFQAD